MDNRDNIVALINQPIVQGQRTDLTHCKANKSDMEAWLSELSLLNMAEVSKQIRTTLSEIAVLNCDEAKRLELMETMRLAVRNLINSLGKHYINQAVVLDNKGINVAQFVQHLRAQSFAIYHLIAQRLCAAKKSAKGGLSSLFSKFDGKKESLAIHRAMSEAAGLLYETKLLYLPDIQGLWSKLHGLYLQAQELGTLGVSFDDPIANYGKAQTLHDVFMRSVVLSIARTNRLRQSEIKKLYEHTELWSPLLKADKSPHANDLFLIDLSSDNTPMYITTSQSLSGNIIYINASDLLAHLKLIKSNAPETSLLHRSEKSLVHNNMVSFVANSIEEPLERHFSRHPCEGTLKVCIGFLGTHYHVAGSRQFADVIELKHLVQQEEQAEILIDKSRYLGDSDLMFDGVDGGPKIDRVMLKVYEVAILDMSPGGYRVSWQGVSAPSLRTGEIMCLKENDPDKWQVGIIRWVQQNPGVGADFGIEVISTKATACGVKPARPEDGQADYMRAILLPEVKSLNRAATIITPNFNFKPNHRIKIRIGSEEVYAKIGAEHISTQSFNHYDFTILANATGKTFH